MSTLKVEVFRSAQKLSVCLDVGLSGCRGVDGTFGIGSCRERGNTNGRFKGKNGIWDVISLDGPTTGGRTLGDHPDPEQKI